MVKKIYDIIPPKVAAKTKSAARHSPRVRVADSKKGNQPVVQRTLKNKSVFLRREVIIGGSVIVILLLVWLAAKLPKAEVRIWPKMEGLYLEEKIAVSGVAKEADIESGIIPAIVVEKEIDGFQEFFSTGVVSNDKKATGTIRIHNKFEPAAAITLVKGTHFLSDSGKSFKILEKVTVPAAKYQKGKLAAGSIDVRVEAAEAGEEYNIGPSKFSVPKLSGTAYFYSVYAESGAPMAGGYIGQVKKATNEDIEKAKNELSERLLSEAEEAIKKELSSEYILLSDVATRQVVNSGATVSPDALVEKFDATAKVRVSALIFKKKDVEGLVISKFYSQLSEDKETRNETIKIEYALESVDIKNEQAVAIIKSSVLAYQSINKGYLADLLSRKAEEGMREIINTKYGEQISKIEIDFWPFWVRKAPKNKDKINVELIFSE